MRVCSQGRIQEFEQGTGRAIAKLELNIEKKITPRPPQSAPPNKTHESQVGIKRQGDLGRGPPTWLTHLQSILCLCCYAYYRDSPAIFLTYQTD